MSARKMEALGITALIGVLAAAVMLAAGPLHAAENYPANKAGVAASNTKVMRTGPADGTDTKELLRATLRTSTTEDLILQVSAECGIDTTLLTPGTSEAEATGIVRLWATVEEKGAPSTRKVVPVDTAASDSANGGDVGKITFCKRKDQRSTALEEQESVGTLQQTAQANGFNWTAFNMGNGIHTVRIWGELTTEDAPDDDPDSDEAQPLATATAVVTRRTLTIVPTKAIKQNDQPQP